MSRNVGRKEKRRASDKVGYSVLHLFKLVNLVTLDPLLGLSNVKGKFTDFSRVRYSEHIYS